MAAKEIVAGGGTAWTRSNKRFVYWKTIHCLMPARERYSTVKACTELDASIMDRHNKSCGAVAGVKTVKNPISLARLVMTKTRHVLLTSDGADRFAVEMGVERVDNKYFSTPEAQCRMARGESGPREGGPRERQSGE